MNPKHRAKIERLQAEAARHPALYKLRLGAVAIGGDILLTAAQIAPWVLPIVGGMVFLNNAVFYLIGSGVVLFFIYLMRPRLRLQGRAVTREEAPGLYAELDTLRNRLQVSKRMEVMLDGTFNAGALETRGLFGLVGKRRVLLLGIPLLSVLPREQVLAVIAHEFGHFSKRHGRLGHWLYRARVGWIEFANEISNSDLVLDKSVAWIAEALIPYFSRISFVHARQCEYEADADAASGAGSQVYADALTRVIVMGRLWDREFPRALARMRSDLQEAPDDLIECFAKAVAMWPADEIERLRVEALNEKPSFYNTHPPLRDRIAALQEMARPLMPADGAGADLLGAAWPGAVEAFNAQWRHGAEWLWAFEHQRFKRVVAPLLQTENAESDLPLAQRLTRATALRALAPADGLAELSRLRKQCPDDPAVTFAYGIALLDDGDPEGASLLEALAIGRPTYRSPAYARLATYFGRIDEELSDRWSERLRGASLRRASATWSFMAAVEDGHGHPSALPPAALGVLLDAIARDSCVERAWLFQGRAALATAENAHAADLELHALIMTLDPEMLSRVGADQDTQGQRYTEVLAALVPADAETPVRSYFTTQPIPAGLHAQPPLFDRRTLRTG